MPDTLTAAVPRGMTPRDAARLLRISHNRIRAMILRGELGAIDTAPRGSRPRYVILPRHIEEYEGRHRAASQTRPTPRRKRTVGEDFFPD